jgi:hypothetical protein
LQVISFLDEIPTMNYVRSNSFVIDPIINEWSEKLDEIIKQLVAEDSTIENQLENFILLEEIIKELKTSQADFVSLLHTQLLKKMNFIAFLFEKYYAKQVNMIFNKLICKTKDLKLLDLIKNIVGHYRDELVTHVMSILSLFIFLGL